MAAGVESFTEVAGPDARRVFQREIYALPEMYIWGPHSEDKLVGDLPRLEVNTLVEDNGRAWADMNAPFTRRDPQGREVTGRLEEVLDRPGHRLRIKMLHHANAQIICMTVEVHKITGGTDGTPPSPKEFSILQWKENARGELIGEEARRYVDADEATLAILTAKSIPPYWEPVYIPPQAQSLESVEVGLIKARTTQLAKQATVAAAEGTVDRKSGWRKKVAERLGFAGTAAARADTTDNINYGHASNHLNRRRSAIGGTAVGALLVAGLGGAMVASHASQGAPSTANAENNNTVPMTTTAAPSHYPLIAGPLIPAAQRNRPGKPVGPSQSTPVATPAHATTPTPHPIESSSSPWEYAASKIGGQDAMAMVTDTISSINSYYASQPSRKYHLGLNAEGYTVVLNADGSELNEAQQTTFEDTENGPIQNYLNSKAA